MVDIPCDPTQIDHTALPWTFLDEAAHPERIVEGAIVITGDAEDPVFARVASLTERPTGVKVHLEILPGEPLEQADAMRRTHLLSAWEHNRSWLAGWLAQWSARAHLPRFWALDLGDRRGAHPRGDRRFGTRRSIPKHSSASSGAAMEGAVGATGSEAAHASR
jgi:hypothetical protein